MLHHFSRNVMEQPHPAHPQLEVPFWARHFFMAAQNVPCRFSKPTREDVEEIVWDPHLLAMFYAVASKKCTLGQKGSCGRRLWFLMLYQSQHRHIDPTPPCPTFC